MEPSTKTRSPVDLALPSLLLPVIDRGDRTWELLSAVQRELIEVLEVGTQTMLVDPSRALELIFQPLARQYASDITETERAYEMLAEMFRVLARQLKRDLLRSVKRLVHPDYYEIARPLTGIGDSAIKLRMAAFPTEAPATLEDQCRAYEARLIFFMAMQTLEITLRDDPAFRTRLMESMRANTEGINTLDELDAGDAMMSVPEDEVALVRSFFEGHRLMTGDWTRTSLPVIMHRSALLGGRYVRSGDVTSTSNERIERLTGCDVTIPWRGRDHRAIVSMRVKSPLSRCIKFYVKSQSGRTYTPDAIGIRIVVSDDDFDDMGVWVHVQLGTTPAGLTEVERPGRPAQSGEQTASRSPFASKRFRAHRVHAIIAGHLAEIQVLPVSVAANVLFGLGDESDRWFAWRRFQMFLPTFRPPSLFGVEWNNTMVRAKNQQYLVHALHRDLKL